ncbi:TonB-dependent receptor [Flavobacterium sp. K5-23]|uniref:SusC/RagA family TonB-linked outer membrane protein n=1 Tax=Flavobacterium sp. K5-23 TaxID=2746225 RepID=UPI00200F0887|nr:TonB-dependent receptor [Flavobacterium sp. K5-23]UQD55496.1 TonB-dependent receptor [Flavobacterium sp. K5-23]
MKQLILLIRRLNFIPLLLCLWIPNISLAQENQAQKTISGKITDHTGSSVPGVNLNVKGTQTATITDVDGDYSIVVLNNKSILIFSAIGYITQEITVANKTKINVSLQTDIKTLEEVIVVGYGTQKKSDVTAAIATVNMKNLEKQPAGNLGTLLQGQVAGVTVSAGSGNPGGNPVILIRGVNSFNKQSPLYVIDGIPLEYSFDLNPSDIETISVLKDASASTIYGARASAGVIIITTKKGKSGEPRINYNMYTSSNTLNQNIDLMDKFQMNKTLKQAEANDSNDPNPSTAPSYAFDDTKYANTDWRKAYFKTAVEQKHDIDISAGGDKVNYRISYSHWENNGNIINSGAKRDNIRLNSGLNFFDKKLTISPILAYTSFKNKDFGDVTGDGNAGFSDIMNIYGQLPHKEIYDANSPNGFAKSPSELGSAGNGNPIGERMLSQNRTEDDYFQVNLSADLKLWKGLSYNYTLGNTYKNSFSFSQTNPYDFGPQSFVENPSRFESRGREERHVSTHTLNYQTTFGDHSLKLLGGLSREEKIFKGTTAGGNHLYSQLLEVLSRLVVTNGSDYIRAGGWNWTERLQSAFGRLNYTFKDKYIVQGSIRRDGSSKFGPLNKYGTFWSVSGGWAVHKEDFFKSSVISELKPRLSYGVLGNEDIPPFRYLSGITVGGNQLNYALGNLASQAVSVGAIATTLGNNNIKWEQTATFNAGVNVGLFDNILTANFDYFNSTTTDMLAPTPIPSTSGVVENIYTNIATMKNMGWEFSTTYRHTGENGFDFDVTGNISHTENKIVKLGSEDAAIEDGFLDFNNNGTTITKKGLPVGSFNLFQTAGIFQTTTEINAYTNSNGDKLQPDAKPGDLKFVDADGNGTIDDGDKVIMGSGLAKLDLGLNFNASYKNFDFSMFLNGKLGQKMYNATKSFLYKGFRSTDVLDAWTPTNTNTSVYRVSNNDLNFNSRVSDYFLEDASFVRLRNLQIGYTIPNEFVSKYKINRLRVYAGAYNLLTITKYSGFDPDLSNTSTFSRGVDRGYYPISKSFVVGINVGL